MEDTPHALVGPDGTGSFPSSIRGFEGLEEAAADARAALAAYVRSTMSDLLRAGVDLQDLADRALAESVMGE